MYELIPIFVGAGIGAAMVRHPRARVSLIVLVAAVAGISASSLSGEIHASWVFAAWDTAQALAMATLTMLLARRVMQPKPHHGGVHGR